MRIRPVPWPLVRQTSIAARASSSVYVRGFILLPLFLCFLNPVIDITEANRWFYLPCAIHRTAVTLVEVPSVALLPDLVKDYDERNCRLALRHALGWYAMVYM